MIVNQANCLGKAKLPEQVARILLTKRISFPRKLGKAWEKETTFLHIFVVSEICRELYTLGVKTDGMFAQRIYGKKLIVENVILFGDFGEYWRLIHLYNVFFLWQHTAQLYIE